MVKSNLEDPRVSMARYHDRYVATMRGQYAAGVMDGEAKSQQKIQEQSQAMQEKDQTIEEQSQEILKLKEVIRKMQESQEGNA